MTPHKTRDNARRAMQTLHMNETTPTSPLRRRALQGLGLAALVGWVWGVPKLRGAFGSDLRFTPIAGAPDFQMLDTGLNVGLTAGATLFAGLDAPDPAVQAAFTRVSAHPCRALFGQTPAQVPIAVFSDFNCPNCPHMDANVTAVVARASDVSLHRHELPLLGRTSITASQAVLAADLQGKYAEMHTALQRSIAVKDPALIRRFAQNAGIDPDQLEKDMQRPDIQNALATSKAISQYLGLIGTPAVVIGRTAILGVQSESVIEDVVAYEKERDATCS